MSSDERRIAPRKTFSIPIRISSRGIESVATVAAGATAASRSVASVTSMSSSAHATGPARVLDMQIGETVNLSERGIYFRSAQYVKIGQSVEVYLTLPRELTGRNPEAVRCCARVVHIEPDTDERGWRGVGASVERFESLQRFRSWDN
jgi:hypothetical protein